MSEQEVKDILKSNWLDENLINNLIATTHDIADKIDCKVPLHQLLFPKYEVPDKYRKLYEKL